jgi:predicted nucleotide-binding protein (sugar kinase/HSP70/actin superfamily)
MPNWDNICCRLIVAVLKREGIDARLMEETPSTIRESLKYNTGQCIPLTAIAEGFRSYIVNNRLNPEKCVLWLSHSTIGCNIKLYPHHIKTVLNSMGGSIEKAGVYVGELSLADIGLRACIGTYFSYLLGGLLRKAVFKIRPYESVHGETDRIMNMCIEKLEKAFLGETSREKAVTEIAAMLETVRTDRTVKKAKVAIFGDMYTRDNNIMNQDLVRFIENNGGEVIPTPYNEYARMISNTYFRKWFIEGQYFSLLTCKSLMVTLKRLERNYYRCFESILGEEMPEYNDDPAEILSEYGIFIENTGESMDNILKIHYLVKHNPDLSLLIQASPALCCPSLVTEAMADRIHKKTGIPVVSVTYDGTGGSRNSVVIPYLKYPVKPSGNPELRFFYK